MADLDKTAPAPAALTNASIKNGNSALFETDTLTPATEVAASGALIEPTIVERVDTKHPAIDDNPRAGQCVAANRIDMNDPSIPGHEAVRRNLEAQGQSVAAPDAPAEPADASKA